MKFVFSTRLCFSCSPVEVMAVLISVDLNLQIVLDSRDLSHALPEPWTSSPCFGRIRELC
jgi:hypothetical protein